MGEERVESQGFFEMLWDCDHCDTKGLLGKSQRYCPECGAKQDPDKRYYPKEGEEKQVAGHSYEGADRHCPACNAPQAAKANNCAHCGAPMDGSAEVRGIATPVAPPEKRRWWVLPLVLVVLGAIGFGVWYRFIRKREETLTVAAHRWERTIAIEEFGDRQESAWRDAMPSDARMSSCHTKERTTRQIRDGEDCRTEKQDKKDGTFEVVKKCTPRYRSEPVDGEWCTYSVRRWQQVDQARMTGTGLAPQWPATPATGGHEALGARRAGKRTETLTLEFGGDRRCDVSDAVWRKHADGARVKLDVRASSGKLVCSSL
jgi:hypothetical protein